MGVTIYDVAREAGVSHTAVSAVMGGREKKQRIGEATARRIRAVAERLGYRRNAIAQAFTSGKTNVIGLVLSSPRHEFLGKILAGAMAAANERGMLLKAISLEEGRIPFAAAVDQCLQHQVAAMLCCDLEVSLEGVPSSVGRDWPICWINCNRQQVGFAVDPDDGAGAINAVDHLVGLGHRRIAFVAGVKGFTGTVDRRRDGFITGMARHGLEVPEGFAPYSSWPPEAIGATVEGLLARPDRPTGIICANDPRAGVVLQVAQRMGICVPQELSVIGFSDDTLSRYTSPPLTTVKQPHGQLGRLAITMLADLIEGKRKMEDVPCENLLPTELLVRKSTGPVNTGIRNPNNE